MASTQADPQIVAELAEFVFGNYCDTATYVIVLYDYLLTLSTEVEVIWTRKMINLTSVLFLVNRYNTLLNVASAALFVLLSQTTAVRNLGYAFNAVTDLVSYIVWASFSAMRVYSLDNRNLALASLALALGLVPFFTNLYPDVMQLMATLEFEGQCGVTWSLSDRLDDILEIATRVSIITCDVVVLYATLSNTYSLRVGRHSSSVKSSLVNMLVRDGTLYFLSLLFLNCMQMTFWITHIFLEFASFTNPISSIIVSHFLLDLRAIYFSSSRPGFLSAQFSEVSHLSSVHFDPANGAALSAGEISGSCNPEGPGHDSHEEEVQEGRGDREILRGHTKNEEGNVDVFSEQI
ncbi:hypothetical protein OBBRIDRAFT_793396 [Obba rivulosa]|uniref:DUF6533 domain-containing protein n=1 Tax=Obba rivulosa TaxID=1052685 RepID=A0A8E2AT15_9APHY|nr:hypothetical protein OBBRIDRAFT_793396 [Obba rivulosa]